MCSAIFLVKYMIKKSNDRKRFSLVFLFLLANEYFQHELVSMLCYDHNFCKLQTLLSRECILRKFHVNFNSATVNILITIVRIFLISKKNSKPLKSTHFPLPRHIAFLTEPPSGTHQMEPASPIQALGVNPFQSRPLNRTIPWGGFAR